MFGAGFETIMRKFGICKDYAKVEKDFLNLDIRIPF